MYIHIHIVNNNITSKKMGNTCLACTSMGTEIETAVSYNSKTETTSKDAITPDYIISSSFSKSSQQVCIKMGPIYRKMKLKLKSKHKQMI